MATGGRSPSPPSRKSHRPPPPPEWKSLYPPKLDALDKFFQQLNQIPTIKEAKVLKRPRSDSDRETKVRRSTQDVRATVMEIELELGRIYDICIKGRGRNNYTLRTYMDDLNAIVHFCNVVNEIWDDSQADLPLAIEDFKDHIVKIISTAGEKKLLGANEILGEIFNCYRELQEILRDFKSTLPWTPLPVVIRRRTSSDAGQAELRRASAHLSTPRPAPYRPIGELAPDNDFLNRPIPRLPSVTPLPHQYFQTIVHQARYPPSHPSHDIHDKEDMGVQLERDDDVTPRQMSTFK